MNHRVIAPLGMLLLLAACAVPKTGGPQVGAAPQMSPQFAYSQPVFREDMMNAGVDYGSAVTFHDQGHVTSLIQNCYANAGTPANSTYQCTLKRCLVLDYVAYKNNQAATYNGQRSGNPFFDRETALRRWVVASPQAGFSTPDEMFQFMRAGYGYAKPTELAALKTHNQQIFVQLQPARGPSVLTGQQT